ncbi:WAS/WASL-interacting protein family member 2-like [Tyto alba]|uniref:WAS/WASL-interacting protein family member 2-like n=1 Tax=Tyto alba TaxID=56313 RepID=UPI001C672986|nr:WAS/WASL-interacting protein family member 2-like [Tyto alba]
MRSEEMAERRSRTRSPPAAPPLAREDALPPRRDPRPREGACGGAVSPGVTRRGGGLSPRSRREQRGRGHTHTESCGESERKKFIAMFGSLFLREERVAPPAAPPGCARGAAVGGGGRRSPHAPQPHAVRAGSGRLAAAGGSLSHNTTNAHLAPPKLPSPPQSLNIQSRGVVRSGERSPARAARGSPPAAVPRRGSVRTATKQRGLRQLLRSLGESRVFTYELAAPPVAASPRVASPAGRGRRTRGPAAPRCPPVAQGGGSRGTRPPPGTVCRVPTSGVISTRRTKSDSVPLKAASLSPCY